MTEFAALVARRLCHDFAGPVGAIATAAELLGSTDDPEVRDLIGESARSLTANLRFYRTLLAPSDGVMAAHDMRDLLGNWLAARDGVTVDWGIEDDEIDGRQASLLLGLALLATESLPRGGNVRVEAGAVTATGARVRLDADAAAGLAGSEMEGTPRSAFARLIAVHAEAAGRTIAVEASDTAVTLRLASAAAAG